MASRKEVLVMKDMGIVSNFVQMGKIIFGDDVIITYELRNDHEDPDPPELIFYLSREIEGIKYRAQKEYQMFMTFNGILLSSKEGDLYFEKQDFQSNIDTIEDCISFNS